MALNARSSSQHSARLALPSSSRCPIMLALLCWLCLLTQHRPVDAFLLSHRNLLLPFASSKGTALSMQQQQLSKENSPVEESAAVEDISDDAVEAAAEQPRKEPSSSTFRLLGFMTVPKAALTAMRQKKMANDLDEQQLLDPLRARRKRMHHLSILRKVGAPSMGGGLRANRLFGQPQELKRTVPLFLIEY